EQRLGDALVGAPRGRARVDDVAGVVVGGDRHELARAVGGVLVVIGGRHDDVVLRARLERREVGSVAGGGGRVGVGRGDARRDRVAVLLAGRVGRHVGADPGRRVGRDVEAQVGRAEVGLEDGADDALQRASTGAFSGGEPDVGDEVGTGQLAVGVDVDVVVVT